MKPPTSTLTSPTATQSITEGDVVVLSATAADSDGSVTSVDFLVDGLVVATSTVAPYSATWTPSASGSYVVTSKAYDDQGAPSLESSVTITVDAAQGGNEKPTVDVALSASTVDVGTVVTLSANAADADGTVDKVDFYVAGTLVGTVATAPYTLDYTTTSAGTLAVYAKATDNLGATTDSALASLVVNGLPTVATCRLMAYTKHKVSMYRIVQFTMKRAVRKWVWTTHVV